MNETRNILLVGRTGQGKSSLANLLVNKNGKFEEVFKVGSGSISATKNPQTETFREDNVIYKIIDTPSFSDTELVSGNFEEEEKIFYKLAQIASEVEGGINQILFVSDGRFTEEEVKVIGGLRSIVFDERMADFLTIVRTRFPEFEDLEKCKEDYESLTKEELINKNKIGSRLVKAIGKEKFIHIDNIPTRSSGSTKETSISIEVKKAARSKLLNHLMNARISYEPENLVKLKKRIKDSADSIEKEKKEIQRKIEEIQRELEKIKERRDLNEEERKIKVNEYTVQLRNLSSRSTKLEEEQENNAKSVAFGLFKENIDMIIKTSEAGTRIGKDALWGVGAPVGGALGFTTGIGGALFNSGVSLTEEGINFLTGGNKSKRQLGNLQSTNSQLLNNLETKNTQIKNAEDIITDLRRQITGLQGDKTTLQSQIDQLKSDNSTLTQQIQDKDGKINEKNQTIQSNQTEIARLKQEKSQLETDKTNLNTTITSLNQQIVDNKSTITNLQGDKTGLQSQVNQLQVDKSTLAQQVQSLQQALSGGPQGTAVIQIPNIPPQGGGSS